MAQLLGCMVQGKKDRKSGVVAVQLLSPDRKAAVTFPSASAIYGLMKYLTE